MVVFLAGCQAVAAPDCKQHGHEADHEEARSSLLSRLLSFITQICLLMQGAAAA
jgi:hypothetical protein